MGPHDILDQKLQLLEGCPYSMRSPCGVVKRIWARGKNLVRRILTRAKRRQEDKLLTVEDDANRYDAGGDWKTEGFCLQKVPLLGELARTNKGEKQRPILKTVLPIFTLNTG